MEDVNKIDLIQIATFLMTLQASGTINGEKGVAMLKVEPLNKLGENIKKIVESECGIERVTDE